MGSQYREVWVYQISFGLEEATDWSHPRRKAFCDALRATERLLDAGLRPCWQCFFATRILVALARADKSDGAAAGAMRDAERTVHALPALPPT